MGRPWGNDAHTWFLEQCQAITDAGRRMLSAHIGVKTLLAEDLPHYGSGYVKANNAVFRVSRGDIDQCKAKLIWSLGPDRIPAGVTMLETLGERGKWLRDEQLEAPAPEPVPDPCGVVPLAVPEGALGRYELQRSPDPLENKRCEHMLCVLRAAARKRFPLCGFSFVLAREPDGHWLEVSLRDRGMRARYAAFLGKAPAGDDFARAEREVLSLIGV